MEERRAGRWLGGLVVGGVVAALFWAERRWSLRRVPRASHRNLRRSVAGARIANNLAIAGVTAAVTHAAMAPVMRPLTSWVERDRIGLTQRLRLPRWARDAVAVLLLDYTLYWWHVVEHRSRWLYRFHQVHHADLALDVSTAARFHFGEFLASVPWRAGQVVAIGVSAFRNPEEVAFGPSLAMPFEPLPPWRLPDGTVPERGPTRATALPRSSLS